MCHIPYPSRSTTSNVIKWTSKLLFSMETLIVSSTWSSLLALLSLLNPVATMFAVSKEPLRSQTSSSPLVWTFVEFMLSLGFTRLHKDRCVFLHTSSEGFPIVSLYVDDLLIIAPTTSLVSSMKLSLSDRFHMKDLGEARDILGWQIERNRSERTLFLHQTRYCETVVERFDMASSNPVHTPFESSKTLSKSHVLQLQKTFHLWLPNYRSLVGSLMYLAMGTRPDLAFPSNNSVNSLTILTLLTGVLQNVLFDTSTVLVPVASFLVAVTPFTIPFCLLTLMQIMRTVQIHVAVLVVTSFFFSEAPFHGWRRNKNIVTLSTTEAEFVALSLCIQECLYIQQLASELKQSSDQPVVIYEDNQSTIHIAHNSEHHRRSKHIDVRYMFVRDLVEAKHFELRYCNTKQTTC
ncbi:hypothetical protein Ae201684P_017386 [Aphanomyces euteiches]|nr:hypothetical protein Ae201684P_017386 [Aphanomyces euteiches]